MAIVTSSDIYGNTYQVATDQLSWRPSAYAIVVHEDHILMVSERGLFHLPGGGVELGETPEQAVVRDVGEETGLQVAASELVGVRTTFFTQAHKLTTAERTHVQSLLLYYSCDLLSGTLSIDGLTEDERAYGLTPEWVPVSRLDDLIVGSTVDWRPLVKKTLAGTR